MDAREHMLMLIPKADAHLHAFFLEILLEVFAQLNSLVHSLYSYIEQTKVKSPKAFMFRVQLSTWNGRRTDQR